MWRPDYWEQLDDAGEAGVDAMLEILIKDYSIGWDGSLETKFADLLANKMMEFDCKSAHCVIIPIEKEDVGDKDS